MPTLPLIALTATAVPAVKADIRSALRLREPVFVSQQSAYRRNLSLTCRRKGEGAFEPVDTAAARGSSSAPLPFLAQPRARAPPLLLGSGRSPFEATRQPSSGRPGTEDLRPNPLAVTGRRGRDAAWRGSST